MVFKRSGCDFIVYNALSDPSNTISQFTRRKKIIITTGGTSTPVDYQIKLTIAYESEMEASFSDVRFNTKAGAYIDMWQESHTDSTTADIWVELSSAITDPGSDIIYMYYGNPSLSDGGVGADTFLRFDGFDGYSDGNLAGNDTWSLVSSNANFQVGATPSKQGAKGISATLGATAFGNEKTFAGTTEKIFGWWMKASDITESSIPLIYLGSSYAAQAVLVDISVSQLRAYNGNGAGSGSWVNLFVPSNDVWYNVEVILDHTNDEYDVRVNGTLYTNGGSHFGFRHAPTTSAYLRIVSGVGSGEISSFDSFYCRKYIINEPTPSYGTAQHQRRVPRFIG